MKVLSYNGRGLGGGEKRVEVWRLVREKNPMVLCIQESKLQVVNGMLIKSVWVILCVDTPFISLRGLMVE